MAAKIALAPDSKAALRREVIAARDALPPTQRQRAAAEITGQLLSLDAYRTARCVLAYMSFGSELDTTPFVSAVLAAGKILCLPRVDRATRALALHCVVNPAAELREGAWGIREPDPRCPAPDLAQIDFVLLPGVAFTPRCDRLGYGGGFYDRLIPQFAQRPPLVAAAFALQIRESIPLETTDQRVDVVLTEAAYYCNC